MDIFIRIVHALVMTVHPKRKFDVYSESNHLSQSRKGNNLMNTDERKIVLAAGFIRHTLTDLGIPWRHWSREQWDKFFERMKTTGINEACDSGLRGPVLWRRFDIACLAAAAFIE